MPFNQTDESLALLTDLYQLTMAQAYLQEGMSAPATFSLFIRRYPKDRSYFVSAGLGDALRYLEEFHVTAADLDYLRSTGIFTDDFLAFVRDLRFTGDVHAIPEGRLFFLNEPVLEVTGPVIEAQFVESFIINQINLQSLIATKASRCVTAAQGRGVFDFALRRTHGVDAAMKVARSSHMAGFMGTSNVAAGKQYGIPVNGTMAHSFITAFEREGDAFSAFARSFPGHAVLLIDTYDTVGGAHKAVEVAREMESRGARLRGVRLDSGDLVALSREVRRIFQDAGLGYVRILASGSLDEFEIAELVAQGAEIDAFGVGTKMGVSADAPWFDIVYKLVSYDRRPVLKLSAGKRTLAGEKQVYRYVDSQGRLTHDVIAGRDEPSEPGAEPLLRRVMEGGRITGCQPSLTEARECFLDEFSRLAPEIRSIAEPAHYRVALSPALETLQEEARREVVAREL